MYDEEKIVRTDFCIYFGDRTEVDVFLVGKFFRCKREVDDGKFDQTTLEAIPESIFKDLGYGDGRPIDFLKKPNIYIYSLASCYHIILKNITAMRNLFKSQEFCSRIDEKELTKACELNENRGAALRRRTGAVQLKQNLCWGTHPMQYGLMVGKSIIVKDDSEKSKKWTWNSGAFLKLTARTLKEQQREAKIAEDELAQQAKKAEAKDTMTFGQHEMKSKGDHKAIEIEKTELLRQSECAVSVRKEISKDARTIAWSIKKGKFKKIMDANNTENDNKTTEFIKKVENMKDALKLMHESDQNWGKANDAIKVLEEFQKEMQSTMKSRQKEFLKIVDNAFPSNEVIPATFPGSNTNAVFKKLGKSVQLYVERVYFGFQTWLCNMEFLATDTLWNINFESTSQNEMLTMLTEIDKEMENFKIFITNYFLNLEIADQKKILINFFGGLPSMMDDPLQIMHAFANKFIYISNRFVEECIKEQRSSVADGVYYVEYTMPLEYWYGTNTDNPIAYNGSYTLKKIQVLSFQVHDTGEMKTKSGVDDLSTLRDELTKEVQHSDKVPGSEENKIHDVSVENLLSWIGNKEELAEVTWPAYMFVYPHDNTSDITTILVQSMSLYFREIVTQLLQILDCNLDLEMDATDANPINGVRNLLVLLFHENYRKLSKSDRDSAELIFARRIDPLHMLNRVFSSASNIKDSTLKLVNSIFARAVSIAQKFRQWRPPISTKPDPKLFKWIYHEHLLLSYATTIHEGRKVLFTIDKLNKLEKDVFYQFGLDFRNILEFMINIVHQECPNQTWMTDWESSFTRMMRPISNLSDPDDFIKLFDEYLPPLFSTTYSCSIDVDIIKDFLNKNQIDFLNNYIKQRVLDILLKKVDEKSHPNTKRHYLQLSETQPEASTETSHITFTNITYISSLKCFACSAENSINETGLLIAVPDNMARNVCSHIHHVSVGSKASVLPFDQFIHRFYACNGINCNGGCCGSCFDRFRAYNPLFGKSTNTASNICNEENVLALKIPMLNSQNQVDQVVHLSENSTLRDLQLKILQILVLWINEDTFLSAKDFKFNHIEYIRSCQTDNTSTTAKTTIKFDSGIGFIHHFCDKKAYSNFIVHVERVVRPWKRRCIPSGL